MPSTKLLNELPLKSLPMKYGQIQGAAAQNRYVQTCLSGMWNQFAQTWLYMTFQILELWMLQNSILMNPTKEIN